jgi:hypothetical protein
MPTRLVLVGYTDAGKLFYNVDATPTDKNAMFVDGMDNETPVDLVSFISINPDIREITTTPFHKFLWGAGEANETDRWNRTFVTRTQPIDEGLLKNIEIKKKPKKRLVASSKNNQIMAFKSLSFSNNFTQMPNSAMRNRQPSRRALRGINTKIIGNVRAGYDGDSDGFVDDGLPTMRPFIPGFDIAKDTVRQTSPNQGMRIRTSNTPIDRFAPVTADEIRRTIVEQDEFLRKRFNGGEPITTIGDVKRILMNELPNFSSGGSTFDFLDGPDDQPLENYAYENIAGFLLVLNANPSMKKMTFEMRKFDIGDNPGVGGSTRYQSGHQWEFVNGRFVVIKNRTPKITIRYRHPMDPQYKSTYHFNSFNEGRFDVSSNIIGSSMLNSMADTVGGTITASELNAVYETSTYDQAANALDDFINNVNISLSPGPDDKLNGLTPGVVTAIARALNDGLIEEQDFSNGASMRQLMEVRDAIRNQSRITNSQISENTKRLLRLHEEMWDIQARTVAIHEATHAAHSAQMYEDMMAFLHQNGVDPATSIPALSLIMIDKMDEKQLTRLLRESTDENTITYGRILGASIRHLTAKAAQSGNAKPIVAMAEFLGQKIYQNNGKPYVLNKELADFMNRLEKISGVNIFGGVEEYSEGDEMTLYQAHILTDKSLLELQRKDVRRQFAGISLYGKETGAVSQNALTLIRQEGYPSLVVSDSKKTKPLSKETGALIADATQSAMGMVARMIDAKTDLASVREVSTFRQIPSDTAGPVFSKPLLNLGTVEKMEIDEMRNVAQLIISSTLPAIVQNQQPSTLGSLLEGIGMEFWHFDSLPEAEVSEIVRLARESAEPGYRNYMSTALNRRIFGFLNANPDSSELIAELAVYDAFGIPIRVTDEAGNGKTKRALTSDEIKSFDKILSWIFPKGKLSSIKVME